MITILNGKLTVPENERFIGFAGDNLNKTIEFLLSGQHTAYRIYRLYLTFDDGTVNYFILPSKVTDKGVVLTWNVLTEHIFKSGLVSAQLKAFSDSGVVYHTNSDTFFVGSSSEYSDDFKSENSEFLRYERQLNELAQNIGDIALMMPYIGDNGNWFVFNADKGEYVDSGKPSMGQADSLLIGDGTVTPSKLDREYWEKTITDVYSWTGLDNLVKSHNDYIQLIHYHPDPDMYEAAKLNETYFIGFANDVTTMQLLDTNTGETYTYTVGGNTLAKKVGEQSIVFVNAFNSLSEIQKYEFESYKLYRFSMSASLSATFGSGYCLGTYREGGPDDEPLRYLDFLNYSTGVCWTLNLSTGEAVKTSKCDAEAVVDQVYNSDSENAQSGKAVAQAIGDAIADIEATLDGIDALLSRI